MFYTDCQHKSCDIFINWQGIIMSPHRRTSVSRIKCRIIMALEGILGKARTQTSRQESVNDNGQSPFIALTPSKDADRDGNYAKAICFALGNADVFNIALTGPYGSGKSSIIQSFLQRNPRVRALTISLASFLENSNDVMQTKEHREKQEVLIERSILQQMLYGADAGQLPYSRFKRIVPPRHPYIYSTLFTVWVVSVGGVLYALQHESILQAHWFFIAAFIASLLYCLIFSTLMFASIHGAIVKATVKRISLKNGEFELGDQPESSIFNRHIDEIIYFFQETDYHLVVIEDLDRFGSTEVFVKLREINKLINDNAGTLSLIHI